MKAPFRTLVLSLLFATSLAAHAVIVDRVLAVVNNETILQSDIEAFRRTMKLRREIDPFMALSESMDGNTPSREKIMDYLIQERIIAQTTKVADTDVENKIAEVMKNNQLDRHSLEGFLRSKGFNLTDYSYLMRVSLQKQSLLDREVRMRVNISDDDVRNHYFNTQLKTAKQSLEYSIQSIFIDGKNYKSARFAQDAAQAALRSINEGEAFADVAKRVSDDPSAPNGGDIGFVAGEQMNPAMYDALKSMKIGSLSGVISSGNAYYVLKLNDIRTSENERLEHEKEAIREQLAKTEYRRQIVLWTERARSTAFVKVNQ
jgi:peptidyl-prolyl cis-trans isomerase SurA